MLEGIAALSDLVQLILTSPGECERNGKMKEGQLLGRRLGRPCLLACESVTACAQRRLSQSGVETERRGSATLMRWDLRLPDIEAARARCIHHVAQALCQYRS